MPGKTRCQVCQLIESNERAKEIINRIKFEETLPLDSVVAKIFADTGITIHKVALLRHYKKHTDPATRLQYERQVNVLKSLGKTGKLLQLGSSGASPNMEEEASRRMRFAPRTKYSFDMLERLKKMFVEMSSKFENFQRETGGVINSGNAKAHTEIANALRGLGSDIARIEASREIVKDVIKQTFTDLFKSWTKEVIALSHFERMSETEKEGVLNQLYAMIEEHTRKLDREFKKRLI